METRDTSEEAARVLARCADAVKAPRWTLFLGRKSCVPTRPIFDCFNDKYDSIEDAFTRHPWSWSGAANVSRTTVPSCELAAYIENASGNLMRQDALQQNASRLYGFRSVREMFFQPVGKEA